jgi:hypothetical protein
MDCGEQSAVYNGVGGEGLTEKVTLTTVLKEMRTM